MFEKAKHPDWNEDVKTTTSDRTSASSSNELLSSKDSESYKQKYVSLSAQDCREIDECEELLKLIHSDLKMRANEEGVVDISNFIWEKLTEWLER